ncbi:hypothetical protein WJU16_12650 [Chitinophaga pollutisoli]|uniref:N-acetyltransferase domain-containing protein n=1 Tax=Chitinophaga pollutisoli TaxID=3133966 RepID=A0ABZ2YG53_9BACT
MIVQKISTGEEKPTYIEIAGSKDFRLLTKHRYSFNRRVYKRTAEAYMLRLEVDNDILGAMKLKHFPAEEIIEVELLSSSKENIGRNKIYDRIPGCLLAYACYKCYLEHGKDAMVMLRPKTVLGQHYMDKYGMKVKVCFSR